MRKKTVFIYFILILAILPVVGATEENITFRTSGATFAPTINVTGSPTILWTFSDGTTDATRAPNKNYGSTGNRNTTLKVDPWSAVTQINVGFDGADGGDLGTPGTSTIEHKVSQNVIAVYGLENVNQSLVVFAISQNKGVTSLNFDNFAMLKTVEAFACDGLANISIANTPKLERMCLESCSIENLNLTNASTLLDLRLANQDTGLKTLSLRNPMNNWHACFHTNPGVETDIPFEYFVNLTELMTQGNDQIGDFNPGSARLKVVYANDNHFTSANLSGKVPTWSATVRLQDNNLTHIDVSNCPGMYILNLTNNNLNTSEIDTVLDLMEANGKTTGQMWLAGTGNAAPSPTGILNAYAMSSRGVTMYVNMPTNTVLLGESTRCRANGTTAKNYANGDANRTLASLGAYLTSDPDASLSNISIIPSSGELNVTVTDWEGTEKAWTASSETHTATAHHILGGFPANTTIQILRDGTNYDIVTSNETGVIDWVYDGGFSEHTFNTELAIVPTAAFEADSVSGDAPYTVQFTDLSTGIPTAWLWDFGDSETSVEQSPSHTFEDAGDYTVTLTATNQAGNDAETKVEYIHVETAPISGPAPEVGMKTEANGIWSGGVDILIVVIIVILTMTIIGLLQGKNITPANITELVIGLMIVMLIVTVGYGTLSSISGTI